MHHHAAMTAGIILQRTLSRSFRPRPHARTAADARIPNHHIGGGRRIARRSPHKRTPAQSQCTLPEIPEDQSQKTYTHQHSACACAANQQPRKRTHATRPQPQARQQGNTTTRQHNKGAAHVHADMRGLCSGKLPRNPGQARSWAPSLAASATIAARIASVSSPVSVRSGARNVTAKARDLEPSST